MLGSMRGPDGGPSARVRLMAILVVVGMVILTAPVTLIPLVRAIIGVITP